MGRKFLLCDDELYNGSKLFEVGKLNGMIDYDRIYEATHYTDNNTEGYLYCHFTDPDFDFDSIDVIAFTPKENLNSLNHVDNSFGFFIHNIILNAALDFELKGTGHSFYFNKIDCDIQYLETTDRC